tara:strand:+ start:516 stop:746 length:231 start_codon:yes stop_codon:yes gene_type:complete
MTCRQSINNALYPRHVSNTHLELAELLRDNLDDWLKGVIPISTPGLRKIYAEEITDQAFDAIQDLALEVDETYQEC